MNAEAKINELRLDLPPPPDLTGFYLIDSILAGNAPALALYDALGLTTELYRYHYLREPQPAAASPLPASG